MNVKDLAEQFNMSWEAAVESLSDLGIAAENEYSAVNDDEQRVFKEFMDSAPSPGSDVSQSGKEMLAYYIAHYKIFMDTSSLLRDSSVRFFKMARPLIEKTGNGVIVPLNVIQEIEQADGSNGVLRRLKKWQEEGLVVVRGSNDGYSADYIFQYVIAKFKHQYPMMLITEDEQLAQLIRRQNSQTDDKSEQILIKCVNDKGLLSNLSQSDEQVFALASGVNGISTEPVELPVLPEEGDTVYNAPPGKKKHKKKKKKKEETTGFWSTVKAFFWGEDDDDGEEESEDQERPASPVKLVKQLGKGGEAVVYDTDRPSVAKIYLKGKLTKNKEAKLKLMLSHHIEYPGLCYPVSSLYSGSGQFIGYLMPKADGIELQYAALSPDSDNGALYLKHFPKWKKADLVQLCLSIAQKVNYLHSCNVVLGDINSFNILVKSPTEIYFVDVDSWQIEGFPCPVGTPTFTAPEIFTANKQYKQKYGKDRHYDEYLRSFDTDRFSLAVLLFMILLSGKKPYTVIGSEGIEQDILNYNFPYPLDALTDEKMPKGPWQYLWSHLPYFIKRDFYESFRKDGKHSHSGTRLSAAYWEQEFTRYLELLQSHKMGSQDELSEQLYPDRYKNVLTKIYGSRGITYSISRFFRKLFN